MPIIMVDAHVSIVIHFNADAICLWYCLRIMLCNLKIFVFVVFNQTPILGKILMQIEDVFPKFYSSSDSESDADSSDDENAAGRKKGHPGNKKIGNMIGQVVCLEIEDRKKTLWVPAVVVQPTADSTDLKQPNEILVKSFKDTKL